jgi:hypothetical protein
MTEKLTRQDILNMLPEHLKGRTLHICQPNDDYDEEEEAEEIDPDYDQMAEPEDPVDKRAEIEKEQMQA